MALRPCNQCVVLRAETAALASALAAQREEAARLRAQIVELTKLSELQAADLARYRKVVHEQAQPNRPEKVLADQSQLAFERIIATISDAPLRAALQAKLEEEAGKPHGPRSAPHGRRRLDLTSLPIVEDRIVPPEVIADGHRGWVRVGEEPTDRLAFRPASYFRLRVVREKWMRADEARTPAGLGTPTILTAPSPDYLWPHFMADPSVMADVILSKYDYLLPLHRQERMTRNRGFVIPRSTQNDWVEASADLVTPLVDLMHADLIARSKVIATDATGAPVRAPKECRLWHTFVFIGDVGHITFRHSRHHRSEVIRELLTGFSGKLLSDASSIYDVLFREGVTAVGCWAHLRRYAWRARETESELAHEMIVLIRRLFAIARAAKEVPMPKRTAYRAELAQPVLDVLDQWILRNRGRAEPRGKMAAAITYYSNQRTALRQFLTDGNLSLDNNQSERELRNLVGGRDNWKHFETSNGLAWYSTFRSLIASCAVHQLNAHDYLEKLLRLVRHWPKDSLLELAPLHWRNTIANLDERHRGILVPPWARAAAPPALTDTTKLAA